MNIDRFKKWYFIVPAAIVATPLVLALIVFIGGGLVMLLWNWLLPGVFGWPEISLLQAIPNRPITRARARLLLPKTRFLDTAPLFPHRCSRIRKLRPVLSA